MTLAITSEVAISIQNKSKWSNQTERVVLFEMYPDIQKPMI
jgi:hypothetical protein